MFAKHLTALVALAMTPGGICAEALRYLICEHGADQPISQRIPRSYSCPEIRQESMTGCSLLFSSLLEDAVRDYSGLDENKYFVGMWSKRERMFNGCVIDCEGLLIEKTSEEAPLIAIDPFAKPRWIKAMNGPKVGVFTHEGFALYFVIMARTTRLAMDYLQLERERSLLLYKMEKQL
jgi:hypothetical protein